MINSEGTKNVSLLMKRSDYDRMLNLIERDERKRIQSREKSLERKVSQDPPQVHVKKIKLIIVETTYIKDKEYVNVVTKSTNYKKLITLIERDQKNRENSRQKARESRNTDKPMKAYVKPIKIKIIDDNDM